MLPNAHYIIGDFDMLRGAPSSLSGICAPTVSLKLSESSSKQDYETYLIERGGGDIFFPTDFRLLRNMYLHVTGRQSESMKSYQFVEEYSDTNWAKTQSGYNPLKEDFNNTAFFMTKK